MASKKPTMLQGENHSNIIDNIIEQQDLNNLLIETLVKKGVVRADTHNISKNIRTNMKLPLFNFIANSSKFRTHFERNSPIINKSVINKSYIASYKNALSSFYSNCTWGVKSTYVKDLGKIMNKFNRIYIYNLGKFKSTFKFTYILKICEILRITIDTLVQLSNVQNVKNDEDAIQYTKSFFDKYIILTYEFYKVSLVYYLSDIKINKNILIHILNNIDTFRIHYKDLYNELNKPSKIKNLENDIACVSFMKYYIKGTIAETEYDSLKSLKNQTILPIGSSQTFIAFSQNKDLQKTLYDKCNAFIFKGGLAYEVIQNSRISLDIKVARSS